jgi:Ni/Co efflux regulator RcnB
MPRLRIWLAAAVSVSALLMPLSATAKPQHCPPGLAKKAVPCVPPGQVGKSARRDDDRDWDRGDYIGDDYVLIPRDEWERLALRDYDDGSSYVRVDNQILRVVRDTLTVIEAVGIVGNLLN